MNHPVGFGHPPPSDDAPRSDPQSSDPTTSAASTAAGLTRQAVHNYESGNRSPTWAAVQKLAEALNVTTDTFRGG